MKANASRHSTRAVTLSLVIAALAGCVPAPQTAHAPQRPVTPPPAPPQVSRPPADWRDAPATPGEWSWTREGTASVARFGGGLFALRCAGPAGPVRLERAGNAAGAAAMTVSTTSSVRALSAAQLNGAEPAIGASLPSSDPLLDAMAFSRGRFAIEVAGMAPLYLPAWPEIARVIEDCR